MMSDLEAVHTKTLLHENTCTISCENAHVLHRFGCLSTRILKTQHLKMHKMGLRVKKIRERSPPVFMWTANPCTFRNDDATTPPFNLLPLTSEPRDVA